MVDDDGTVIGVVSETGMLTRHVLDLAREALAGEHAGEGPREPDGLTAGDLMTQPAVTTTPDESLENAARLMCNCRVRRPPVVGAGAAAWPNQATRLPHDRIFVHAPAGSGGAGGWADAALAG